jgi:hypothetical protein
MNILIVMNTVLLLGNRRVLLSGMDRQGMCQDL